jgi:hypothetical protein
MIAWNPGIGDVRNIAHQCDEPHDALISESGSKLIYIGESRHFGLYELFDYQDEYVEQFALFASRLNREQVPTTTWTVAFRESFIHPMMKDERGWHKNTQTGRVEMVVKRKAPRWDGMVTPKLVATIKSNIESALMSHPTWPSDYGRPDIPARWVEFIPEVISG